MKKISNYVFMLLIFTLTGCQGSPESIVREGTLDFDKSVVLENVLSNYKYFSTKKWESSKDSQSRKVVTFMADFDYKKFASESFVDSGKKISKHSLEKTLPMLKNIKCQDPLGYKLSF